MNYNRHQYNELVRKVQPQYMIYEIANVIFMYVTQSKDNIYVCMYVPYTYKFSIFAVFADNMCSVKFSSSKFRNNNLHIV